MSSQYGTDTYTRTEIRKFRREKNITTNVVCHTAHIHERAFTILLCDQTETCAFAYWDGVTGPWFKL